MFHNQFERLEERYLEQHDRHLAIEGNAVQHLDDAVVRQCRVGCEMPQQRAVGADDLAVNEATARWRDDHKHGIGKK